MLYNSFCTCVIREKGSRSLPFRHDGTGFLFKYEDKLLLFINKFLADRIKKGQELLVKFKDTNKNETVTRVLIVNRNSFICDEEINHNVTIAVLEDDVDVPFYRLEKDYSPAFPLHSSNVNILAIDNNGKALANFDATSPYELHEFTGKISYVNESLKISNLGVIEDQQIVF